MRSSPPTPPRSAARGTSVDRSREGTSGVHSAHYRLSSLSTVPEIERPVSRSSINFSRPISPPAVSENRPLGLDAVAVREVPSAEATGAQKSISQMSGKAGDARPKTHARGLSEGRKPINSSEASIGTAVAAAQAVSAQKVGPRADPAHARVARIDTAPSDLSVQDPADHALPVAASTETGHPPSRAIPERWPSTVAEEKEPGGDNADAYTTPARELDHRAASASPTVDHVDALTTPQLSPKADKESSPQQQTRLRQSSSPGRSARFAKWLSVNPVGDQMHQPPARSVSPVKSALKPPRGNSLSPDRRAGTAGRGIQPPSEVSDGTSVASDEGSRFAVRRKPVKVSFDDEAEVVGVAASPPTSPEEYVPESPPNKFKSRMGWLGIGRKKPSDFGTGDDDFDEVMKPRPELPSFGSVRGNRDGNQRPPIPDFSDDETSSSDGETSATRGTTSVDSALAGTPSNAGPKDGLSQGINSAEQLPAGAEPSVSEQKSTLALHMDGIAVGALTEQQPSTGLGSQLPMPSIAVEPATPPVDERTSFDTTRSSLERYSNIPGGFPPSNSDRSLKSIAGGTNAQPVASAVPKRDDLEQEGESDDSVYSDAPEAIDGDGFGSINAIVDSRSAPRSSAPLTTIRESREPTPKAADRIAAVDVQSQDVTDQAVKNTRSVTPAQESTNLQVADSPSVYNRPSPRLPSPPLPAKSKARVSQTPNGDTQLDAKKQRAASVDIYGGPRTSAQEARRSEQSNGFAAGKNKTRPASLGPAFQINRPSAGFPNSLRRTASNGSDSSSSFKRSTPSPRGEGQGTMRRTMRASSTYAAVPFPSGRAESPADYRPLSSGSGTGTMRKTLRNPGGGNERHSFFSSNKKAHAPRARFGKAKKGSRFVDSDDEDDGTRPQVFRSRFADSSDEDEPGSTLRPVRGIPRRHGAHDGDSTELEDSSEEDRRPAPRPLVAPAAVVTPPTSRGRDSQPSMSGLAAVARQRGMTQRELEEFLMQPPRGRRSSLLTRLGIKKPKNPDNRVRKADIESPSRRDTPLERSRLEREHIREESYANGDRGVTTTVTAGQYGPTSSPGLLKKNQRHSISGYSWPLRHAADAVSPAPVAEQNHAPSSTPLRPEPAPPVNTSDHNGDIHVNGEVQLAAIKETDASRAGADVDDAGSDITNTTNNEEPGPSARDVVIAGSGRKKQRFSLLRKAFGRKI